MTKKKESVAQLLFPSSSKPSNGVVLRQPFSWHYQRQRLEELSQGLFRTPNHLARKLAECSSSDILVAAYMLILVEMGKDLEDALKILELTNRVALSRVNQFYRVTAHHGYKERNLLIEGEIVDEAKYFPIHTSLSDGLLLLQNVVQTFTAAHQLSSVGKLSIPEPSFEE